MVSWILDGGSRLSAPGSWRKPRSDSVSHEKSQRLTVATLYLVNGIISDIRLELKLNNTIDAHLVNLAALKFVDV